MPRNIGGNPNKKRLRAAGFILPGHTRAPLTALDFGGQELSNSGRYYTVPLPELGAAGADFCFVLRVRPTAGRITSSFWGLCDQGSDTGTTPGFWLILNSGNNGFTFTAIRATGGTEQLLQSTVQYLNRSFLIVTQRRGSNYEQYVVLEGEAAGSPQTTASDGTTIPAATYRIGSDQFDFHAACVIGEFALLTGSSLTASQVTTLAKGARITAVATPAVELRFRSGPVATETNLGSLGSSSDATRVGSGFYLRRELFPDAGTTTVTATLSLSAAVQAGRTAATSIGAGVQDARSATSSFNAAVQQVNTAAASINAAVQLALSAAASIQAAVQAPQSAATSLQAAVQAGMSATAAIQAAVSTARSATAAIEAYVQAPTELTATLDTMVQVLNSASSALQAAVLEARTASTTVDVAVQRPLSATAALEAAVRYARSADASISAAIASSVAASAGVQTAVRQAFSAVVAVEAAVQHARSAVVAIQSAVSVERLASLALDAMVETPALVGALLDVYVTEGRRRRAGPDDLAGPFGPPGPFGRDNAIRAALALILSGALDDDL